MGPKHAFLLLSRSLGLFALTRRFSRPKLRILCYHGFSFDDAHRFRAKLFMTPATFARRLDYLVERGFQVVGLEQAVQALSTDELQRDTVSITFDDGWYGVHALAAQLLAERGLPSTLYLTSYYVDKQSPVFRIVVQYLLWKSELDRADLDGLVPGLGTDEPVRGRDSKRALWALISHGEEELDDTARNELLAELAKRLNVASGRLFRERHFGLVSVAEAKELLEMGMDLQLHTHRHRMPFDADLLADEINRNRELLAQITSEPRRHFCYPSGEWAPAHLPQIRNLGIVSATTCDPGVNRPGQDALVLKRFLDGEDVSDLEFEAELAGFTDLLRGVKRLVKRK